MLYHRRWAGVLVVNLKAPHWQAPTRSLSTAVEEEAAVDDGVGADSDGPGDPGPKLKYRRDTLLGRGVVWLDRGISGR